MSNICVCSISNDAEKLGREFLASKKTSRVLLVWREVPSRFDFLDKVLTSMAELAVDIFPQNLPDGISPAWFNLAHQKICAGKLPIMDVSYQQNVRELSLIAGENLEIMLVLNCANSGEDDSAFFMKKAQWLAECADAKVVVVFSEKKIFAEHPERTFSNVAKKEFFSIVERMLWDGIQKEAELSGQFVINKPFRTALGKEIMPDFFCAALQFSVEVDGFTYHSGKKKFASDRQRDYEMLLSGCTTLRLPAKEILKSVELSVKKVLNVFRFLQEERNAKNAKIG